MPCKEETIATLIDSATKNYVRIAASIHARWPMRSRTKHIAQMRRPLLSGCRRIGWSQTEITQRIALRRSTEVDQFAGEFDDLHEVGIILIGVSLKFGGDINDR